MSQWIPCVKCGLFVSVGMEVTTNALCHKCLEGDERFFYPHESVSEGQKVEGKGFEGVVEYLGMESEVKVTDSDIYTEGEYLTIDKSHLRPLENTS